jgi:hypothetical protein
MPSTTGADRVRFANLDSVDDLAGGAAVPQQTAAHGEADRQAQQKRRGDQKVDDKGGASEPSR